MKRCHKCLTELDERMFHADKSKSDGLYTICKKCRAGKSDLPNIEDGYRACKSCGEIKKDFEFYTSTHATRRTCKKCSDEKWSKSYSIKQPQMKLFSLIKMVGDTISGKIKRRERDRAYYKKNGIEKNRKFRASHPEYSKVYANKRRTLINDNGQIYTSAEWEATKIAFKNKCAYCGKEDKLTLDHFVPVSKGGGTNIKNVVPACKSCNSRKRNIMPNVFCSKDVYFSILIILKELK